MKGTRLYEQLMGLEKPCSLRGIDVSPGERCVVVESVSRRGKVWVAPKDYCSGAYIKGLSKCQRRSTDSGQFKMLIRARAPKLNYKVSDFKKWAVPWAEHGSLVTLLIEVLKIKLLQCFSTLSGTWDLTRFSLSAVNAIMPSAVKRGTLGRRSDGVPHLRLDEESSERGHSYVSILTHFDCSRVFDLMPERKLEVVKILLETRSSTQRAAVRAEAMDLSAAFKRVARACMSQADRYRSLTNYRTKIMLRCGKLNMSFG